MKIKQILGVASLIVSLGIVGMGNSNSGDEAQREVLIKTFETAKKFSLEVIEAMPESKLAYKPSAEVRSFADQIIHFSYNLQWMAENRLSEFKNPPGAWSPPEGTSLSKTELTQKVGEWHDNFIQSIQETEMEPDRLLAIVMSMARHSYHHRGQAVVYLRLNGIKPPSYQ